MFKRVISLEIELQPICMMLEENKQTCCSFIYLNSIILLSTVSRTQKYLVHCSRFVLKILTFWIPNPNGRTDKEKKRGKERGQKLKCPSNRQGAAWEVGEQLVETRTAVYDQKQSWRERERERQSNREMVGLLDSASWLAGCSVKRWVSYRVKELERASGRAAEAGQCVWTHDTLHDALHAPTANAASNLKTIPVCTATHRGSGCCKTMCFLQSPLGRSQKKTPHG